MDTPYPFPIDKLPALKQEILRQELRIETSTPDDDVNNTNNDLQSDIKG